VDVAYTNEGKGDHVGPAEKVPVCPMAGR